MPAPPTEPGVLTAWLTPARAARGPLRTLSVGRSFLVHLLGLVLFLLGLVAVTDLELVDLIDVPPSGLGLYLLGVSVLFFLIQGAYVWSALLTVCWGAGPEAYGACLRRTLSRWYQLTPWHAALTLGLIAAMIGIDDLQRDYYQNYYGPGSRQVIEQERMRFMIDLLRMLSLTAFYGLGLVMTLPALAVHRDRPTWHASCRWPACCEGCGYALVGLDDDHTCPECGKPVRDSRHAPRGTIKGGFFAITRTALTRPTLLGEHLLTRRPTKTHVRVLVFALLLTVAVGPVGVALLQLGDRLTSSYYERSGLDQIRAYLFGGVLVGVGMAFFGAFLLLAFGSVGATLARIFGQRNAMPAYCQAACLSAGLLPIWGVINFVMILILRIVIESLDEAGRYRISELLPFAWLGLNAMAGVLYLVLISRIARAARFANV